MNTEMIKQVIVFILVSGAIYFSLAEAVASSGAARVYTPDLRGHGRCPQRRGDVDYINQLVDDLADLIDFIRHGHPETKIVLGGHSSGGGLALRFAGSQYGGRAKAYLLMAPFLKYNAPTTRPNSGGWPGVKVIESLAPGAAHL
jgi:alpha-beta hydrolase superfamily lysophospholipase